MIPRRLTAELERALARQAAVALIGPRQVGKTTLALAVAAERNALYLDLEDRDDRNRLANPALFLEAVEDRLVILDEIHRLPELFDTLRGVIDRGRRRQKGKGRFLILGSASLDLLRQSAESLAGRIACLELTTLTALEVANERAARERLWLRGGFPDHYLADSDADSLALRRDFIRTYLERDVPLFGPRIPAVTLERLWTMLAHLQGSTLNASQLARALEVSTPITALPTSHAPTHHGASASSRTFLGRDGASAGDRASLGRDGGFAASQTPYGARPVCDGAGSEAVAAGAKA